MKRSSRIQNSCVITEAKIWAPSVGMSDSNRCFLNGYLIKDTGLLKRHRSMAGAASTTCQSVFPTWWNSTALGVNLQPQQLGSVDHKFSSTSMISLNLGSELDECLQLGQLLSRFSNSASPDVKAHQNIKFMRISGPWPTPSFLRYSGSGYCEQWEHWYLVQF